MRPCNAAEQEIESIEVERAIYRRDAIGEPIERARVEIDRLEDSRPDQPCAWGKSSAASEAIGRSHDFAVKIYLPEVPTRLQSKGGRSRDVY